MLRVWLVWIGGFGCHQELRRPLVPSAKGLPLTELMREVDDYGELTGSKVRILFCYVFSLLPGEGC